MLILHRGKYKINREQPCKSSRANNGLMITCTQFIMLTGVCKAEYNTGIQPFGNVVTQLWRGSQHCYTAEISNIQIASGE